MKARSLLLALLSLGISGCGGQSDGQTSVLLIVLSDGTSPRPVEVQIDVFEGNSAVARETLLRAAAAGTQPQLGDLVVYPAPGTPSLRMFVTGRFDGRAVSSAAVQAIPKAGQQVEVRAVLMAGAPQTDGGVPATDAGADMNDGDANAGMTADAGAQDVAADGRVAPVKKLQGEACEAADQCLSGACLGGVCCDKACDSACSTCKAAGQPLGLCMPLADGNPCRAAACAANRRSLSQFACQSGVCTESQRTCATRMCDEQILMCQ